MPAKSEQDKLYQSLWEQWPENSRMLLSAVETEPCLTLRGPLVRVVWEQLKKTFLWVTTGREMSTGSRLGRKGLSCCLLKWVVRVAPMSPVGLDGQWCCWWEAGGGWTPSNPSDPIVLGLAAAASSGSGAHMASVLWQSFDPQAIWGLQGDWECCRCLLSLAQELQ